MLVGKQIGPFDVEKEIGSGAMGAVFRARYTKTGQRVAIKVMSPSLGSNQTALARFEREGEILKQLRHPNIVRLFATGKYHGSPFYAMEYVEGESLDHVMARRGRMTWEEVVTLGRQLCAALQHAHEQGIIHRDLKPSNLMVLSDGTVKLTDFGIAKDTDVTALTSANCTVGTAAYMSPEQCRGERDLTLKSDLYSMGVLFYELITGKKPFRAETPMDMFLLHVQGTFERPSRLVLDMPVWLDTLICQLMEKKPEQRPLNAAAVSEALERIVEKVEAQQSAGVDAVRARGGDHPSKRPRLDEEDKDAARTLLGKRSKKRRKKKEVAYYRFVWIKAAVLVAVLAVVVSLIYVLFLKKPTPEKLFAQAKELMASKDSTDWVEAWQGPITKFLKYYPERDDNQARQMRTWADQVALFEQERLLLLWIRNDVRVTSDEERTARQAVRLEEDGDIDEAWKQWKSLLEYNQSDDTKLRPWGLLAEKRMAELQAVYNRKMELEEQVKQARKQLQVFKPKETIERQAASAIHYALVGDFWLAQERWEKLRHRYNPKLLSKGETSPEQRTWFLLAAWQNRKMRDATPKGKERSERMQKEFDKIDRLRKHRPKEAKFRYQEIIALYEDDNEEAVAKLAGDARERLKKMAAPAE